MRHSKAADLVNPMPRRLMGDAMRDRDQPRKFRALRRGAVSYTHLDVYKRQAFRNTSSGPSSSPMSRGASQSSDSVWPRIGCASHCSTPLGSAATWSWHSCRCERPRNADCRPRVSRSSRCSSMFEHSIALYRAGRIAEAEQALEEILQQQPNHFDALHLLGPVSYTHLDVYKRQIKRSRLERFRSPRCRAMARRRSIPAVLPWSIIRSIRLPARCG